MICQQMIASIIKQQTIFWQQVSMSLEARDSSNNKPRRNAQNQFSIIINPRLIFLVNIISKIKRTHSYNKSKQSMYQNFFRKSFSGTISNLFRKTYNKYKPRTNPLLSLTIGAFAIFHSRNYFMVDDAEIKSLRQQIKEAYEADKQMKKIIQVEVCRSEDIKQNQLYPIKVRNHDGSDYVILVVRYQGKLYAVGGQCTNKNLLDENQPEKTMENAVIFNDKLMCPYHGCAFDIKTGSVQYGPAYHNLPIFAVNERAGIVSLSYPQKIPKRINPRTTPRDYADQRKVVILGQDHNATVGCVDGLRQYGFDGQISVILQTQDYPYHKDMLHKSILNLKLKDKYKKLPANIDKQIQDMVNEKIYSKLYFHPQKWYEEHGIEFVYNSEPYRIIHKRFYPYITFFDGTKREYDGLVIASDVLPAPYKMEGINCNETGQALMADNVFMPFRNKAQHLKMLKFLNTHNVKNMIVFGLDQYTLEFLNAFRLQFPDVKVKVIDVERENKVFEMYGEELAMRILSEYSKRNMEFYLKVNTELKSANKMAKSNIEIEDIELKTKKHTDKEIHDSVTITIGEKDNQAVIKGDCVVMFPGKYQGNTVNIKKKGKYLDLDFTQENKIITEPNTRTDTARIFSAGTVSELQFFFSKSRLSSFNPLVGYEQGMVTAFNLLALGVPFAYIPVQITQHFGKKLYQAGSQTYVNQMIVLGSIQKWDFLILYAKNEKIYNVVASESRQREFQVVREAFRLQCEPQFDSLVTEEWNIPKLHHLIKKLNKSFCYRDQIHKLQQQPIKSNIIWVQRRKGAGFANDKPQEDETGLEIDERGYVREV